MVNINSVEGIESLIDKRTKPLKEEILKLRFELEELKQALTIHIVSNALFCENCNDSHMHTRYGNGELRCDNCDNVAKL